MLYDISLDTLSLRNRRGVAQCKGCAVRPGMEPDYAYIIRVPKTDSSIAVYIPIDFLKQGGGDQRSSAAPGDDLPA
jgi:hypothetical protein